MSPGVPVARLGSQGRQFRPCLIIIFVFAFLFRLVFIATFAKPPESDHLWNDAVGWNLATGRGFTASQTDPPIPGLFRTPGYPGFLALVYLIFGHSHGVVFVLQGLLDSLNAVLLSLIGARLLARRLALLAGGLYACYPYSAIHCSFLHQDILLTFLVQVVLLLTIHAYQTLGRGRDWLAVGLVMGLVVLVKAYLLLFAVVPLLAILMFVRSARQKVPAIALFCAGIMIVIGPWLARNAVVFHTFPLMAAGGFGSDLMLLVDEVDAGEEYVLSRYYSPSHGNPGTVRAKEHSYLQQFVDGDALLAQEGELTRTASRELIRRWPRYLLVAAQHVPRLWLTRHAEGQRAFVAAAGQWVSWCFFLPGLVGLILARRQWRRLVCLYGTVLVVTLIYAPYLAEARYTLPARPVFMLFVALTLSWVWDRLSAVTAGHRPRRGATRTAA